MQLKRKKKKKKRKREERDEPEMSIIPTSQAEEGRAAAEEEEDDDLGDYLTEAQKRYQKTLKDRESKLARKLVSKTHRQKVPRLALPLRCFSGD